MRIAIIGYGGHAREVEVQINQSVDFFVDDEFVNEKTKPISELDIERYVVMVAIADCKQREKIVNKLPKETRYFTFIHPTALIMDKSTQIGVGSFIGANSILTTNIKIGKHSILNRGNQIGHDSNIGDFFSAMPGSVVSGNVEIGDRCYMGTNSTVREKISICNDTTIGSNAAVVKNITTGGVYVGVPAKFLKK